MTLKCNNNLTKIRCNIKPYMYIVDLKKKKRNSCFTENPSNVKCHIEIWEDQFTVFLCKKYSIRPITVFRHIVMENTSTQSTGFYHRILQLK